MSVRYKRLAPYTTLSVVLVLSLLVPTAFSGVHCKRAKVLCGIPSRYHFDRGGTVTEQSAMSALASEDMVFQKGKLGSYSVDRKRFGFEEPALEADPVTVSGVGVAIYSTGQIVATGALTHAGEPQARPAGTEVTVRIRAYAASTPEAARVANAPVFWEASRTLWVRPGTKRRFSFSAELAPELRRHFHEVSHLELNLQLRKSDSNESSENAG